MTTSRRDFLKIMGLAGATGVGTLEVGAASAGQQGPSDHRMGVLVDTTVCIGCRRCEMACKEAHSIDPGPESDYDNRNLFETERRPIPSSLTVVNRYGKEPASHVKMQCMHCDYPACVSACIVGAFSKHENGAVTWDSDKCIGCRYCMIACPFQVPAFEYDKAIHPRITKCDFCIERTATGLKPACVATCPVEALTYGKRIDLARMAQERVESDPDRYSPHIYGLHEVGGTSWMYLASRDLQNLAFPERSDRPAPGASEAVQHGIFKYFIPPLSLYALLGGVMWLGRKESTPGNGGES